MLIPTLGKIYYIILIAKLLSNNFVFKQVTFLIILGKIERFSVSKLKQEKPTERINTAAFGW